jgi:hypothetical protein
MLLAGCPIFGVTLCCSDNKGVQDPKEGQLAAFTCVKNNIVGGCLILRLAHSCSADTELQQNTEDGQDSSLSLCEK